MANEENDFSKLLRDAAMAPDADTVTVVGTLARTHDTGKFVLTLPGGQAETLDVAAVKSAKTIAGAIGQPVVQLELDAKRVPEKMRDEMKRAPLNPLYWPYGFGPLGPFGAQGGPYGPSGTPVGALGDPSYAPFVAALPHQADPATIAALRYYPRPTHTGDARYPDITIGVNDHIFVKAHTDPMPDALSYFHKLPITDRPKPPREDNTFPISYPPYHTSDF
jgi:hypothetical protein